MNYFEVFDLERKLGIDREALQRAYYELSRRWHPDYQQGASADAQAQALDRSALVNAAYRTLRDPLARIEYLVRLEEGRETKEGATVKPQAPPELLEEIFELQETLQEAKAGGLDAAGRARLAAERDTLASRHRAEEARLSGSLSAQWDAAGPGERAAVLDAFKRSLATRAYLKSVLDDLNAVLDESQESHVAHHRH
ncbi:MAG: Fe-S protein assembly co-chaperone HscB [Candidatus Rokubacteria bacterium]|nr:Fe-S protein assembly co-chaperone HscB [Candidatus Rokubacteria bacterium]